MSVHLIFSGYFTADVVRNNNALLSWDIMLYIGLAFSLLVNAFNQGKALKDEQELTV